MKHFYKFSEDAFAAGDFWAGINLPQKKEKPYVQRWRMKKRAMQLDTVCRSISKFADKELLQRKTFQYCVLN